VSCGRETFLIDMDGRVVREWRSDRNVFAACLMPDGTLIRDGSDAITTDRFGAGGAAGIVEAVTWDNKRLWSFQCRPSHQYLSHHDIEVMPNGNVLILVWERISAEDAINMGRRAELLPDNELWNNILLELRPNGRGSADVVWSWSFSNHLVQDCDKSKANYGDVAASPHRIDINICPRDGKAGVRGLKRFEGKDGKTGERDWIHCNSISYDPSTDRIALGLNVQSEIIIIDHSASNRGIMWRYGNPQNYRRGGRMDQVLFNQHAAQFVDKGRRILCFNNGRHPDRWWSTIDEIEINYGVDDDEDRKHVSSMSSSSLLQSIRGPSETSLVPLLYQPKPLAATVFRAASAARKKSTRTVLKDGEDGDNARGRSAWIRRRVARMRMERSSKGADSWDDVDSASPSTRDEKERYARDWSSPQTSGRLVWSYGPRKLHAGSFYCSHMSSCQRLKNGNTLIVQGPQGIVSEVTRGGEEVWRWISPILNLKEGESGAVCFVRQGDQRPSPNCEHYSYSIFQAWRYSSSYFSESLRVEDKALSLALRETEYGSVGKCTEKGAAAAEHRRRYLEPWP